MARYEGMDTILQRLNLRFGQEESPAAGASEAPSPASTSDAPGEPSQHRAALESMSRLRREAQTLCGLLSEPGAAQFSPGQHDELLALLGRVMQDLWNCEAALQRLAPFD